MNNSLKNIQEKIHRAAGKREEIKATLEKRQTELGILNTNKPILEDAQALIQETARETQEQLKYHLEDIIQMGLEICFPEEYTAYVEFESKRGKTECDIYLRNEAGKRIDPVEDSGGGLVDIVSLALRMACWVISSSAPVIFFDEPFKWVDISLRPLAGELLKTISEKLNIQILMVTHDEEMRAIANKIFEIKKIKRKSIIEEKIIR